MTNKPIHSTTTILRQLDRLSRSNRARTTDPSVRIAWIAEELVISKSTTRTYLNQLVNAGLAAAAMQGNAQVFVPTASGRAFLASLDERAVAT